jgi:hypothetical protein
MIAFTPVAVKLKNMRGTTFEMNITGGASES